MAPVDSHNNDSYIFAGEATGPQTRDCENGVRAIHLAVEEEREPGVALLCPSIHEILDNSKFGPERWRSAGLSVRQGYFEVAKRTHP